MNSLQKIGRKEEEFRKILENPEDYTSEAWSRLIEDYRLDRLPSKEQSVILQAYYRILNQGSN
jgi:DNA-directed RNA polymerase specialized sigma24 family protein